MVSPVDVWRSNVAGRVMALRRFLVILLCVLSTVGGALAQDWRIGEVAGTARAFVAGDWTSLEPGAALPPDQPALATAQGVASGRFDAETLPTKIALVDKTPTGALQADAAASAIADLRASASSKNGAASAHLAGEAADAVHEERRKAKLG